MWRHIKWKRRRFAGEALEGARFGSSPLSEAFSISENQPRCVHDCCQILNKELRPLGADEYRRIPPGR